jgi:hypothetical protein
MSKEGTGSSSLQSTLPDSRKTHILEDFSYGVKFRLLYSRLVMPTNKGKGASIISMRACGRIGTRARHHLNGYRSAFKPRTAEDN